MEGRGPSGEARQAPWVSIVRSASLGRPSARAVGRLCGVAATSGVFGASVAAAAHDRGAKVPTSDPDDLRRHGNRLDVVPD
jgi:hypothetical protein